MEELYWIAKMEWLKIQFNLSDLHAIVSVIAE